MPGKLSEKIVPVPLPVPVLPVVVYPTLKLLRVGVTAVLVVDKVTRTWIY